ncbi:MAG TPA: hypothetical protein VFE19_10075 [Jatrophihabitantaceae bacterium]|jgi:hypothetical protein|nr:hypothetical protein [Jatrophihabitantaceae bacterium]
MSPATSRHRGHAREVFNSHRTRRSVAGVAVLLVIATAGCGSSGGGPASPSAPVTHPHSSRPAKTTQSSGKPARALKASAIAQIKHAYETFFNGKTPVSTSETLLQNGPKLKATLAAQAKSPTAQALSAKVTKVARAPGNSNPNVAQATFALLQNGKQLLPPTPGYAVLDHGKWKVSAATFCGLLQLQPNPPKKCSQAAITAFPTG